MLVDVEDYIILNREVMKNWRYVDDIVLLANSPEGLEKLINPIVEINKKKLTI